jgi:hypothetical protein
MAERPPERLVTTNSARRLRQLVRALPAQARSAASLRLCCNLTLEDRATGRFII